ncbi:AGE family epimerase/isomerase [Lichenihabitans sp. Uapishka_5]|uniref:AGE family epimerase/isomerase n=1 Tax=Lichenihabitans sp. Uapishka_5 TaxID=3037302 RepID=UPI0029E7DAFF|nr:AGE family epimerase/isomerase [Lichenihabitans sp. Uapishka_5]MDX7949990.1 AGE family epimerase/isomerase [Lichenihabitans sp. Uapishka_5]
MSGSAPRIRFDAVRRWLFDAAWPFWAQHGVDRLHGGFVEHLDLTGRDAGVGFKRMRSQTRQTFCFTQAALLGWEPGRAVADHGWAFLQTHGRRPDGGWVRRMGRDGGRLDETFDAYEVAFVLFLHAWRYRLTPEPALVEAAIGIVAMLDRHLGRPDQQGWLAQEGCATPLQQNPHMHLMEAAVELALATGDPRFATLTRRVADLALDRMIDPETGALREFFDATWQPLPGDEGRVVEPGHQFEWVWLLLRAEPVLGKAVAGPATLLFDSAQRHGVHPETGLVYDRVDVDGRLLDPHHRLWAQTEALKACLAMLEHLGHDTRPRIAACVDVLLDRYLHPAEPTGTWIDHLAADGAPMVDKIPATTLYHIQLAFAELLRLQPRLEAA